MHTVQLDGPYIWYANGQIQVRYVLDDHGSKVVKVDSVAESGKDGLVLTINTDQPGQSFSVRLKSKIEKEKAETKKVSKQFVVSDIEGNFSAFKNLLQAGGVIDSSFNWIFGDGHLVLIGDFFDRGEQVTEVLWLIYSLEEKAKAAGGYVHYILGNHEIMNMSGDLRYVHKKYLDAAVLLNQPYVQLFGEQTELGRWLRSKNIMERVGEVLYTHGGVSAEMNAIGMNLSEINKLSQPFYHDSTYVFPDPRLNIIFGDFGPFWYRGYYTTPKAPLSQLDSTLNNFNVRHVITGHTVVADSITSWHGGKLLDTDVHHASGKSEALFIQDGQFFRVKPSGEKILLISKKR